MGTLKKSGIVILSTILFVLLILASLLLVLSFSINYDNVKTHTHPLLESIIYENINVSNVSENFEYLKLYCFSHTEFILPNEFYDFKISCDEIRNGTAQSVIDSQIDKFIDDIYYKDYQCSLFQCFGQEKIPFFLISEMSRNYILNKFYIGLGIIVVLSLLIFFLFEEKKNFLIVLGSLIAASSILLFVLPGIIILYISSNKYASEIISIFSSSVNMVFWIMFILGVFLLAAGIGLRIWGNQKPAKKR